MLLSVKNEQENEYEEDYNVGTNFLYDNDISFDTAGIGYGYGIGCTGCNGSG